MSVETNLMSLAGLAISIGVLVDSSIVMAENSMHRLKKRFGDQPVRGDTREEVLAACREVGRPIFFSVLIMLLSFLPVFALSGIEGKMFHPLAFTKSFAMLGVGMLAITLVPALCTVFPRRAREEDIRLVRGLMRVYRPVLVPSRSPREPSGSRADVRIRRGARIAHAAGGRGHGFCLHGRAGSDATSTQSHWVLSSSRAWPRGGGDRSNARLLPDEGMAMDMPSQWRMSATRGRPTTSAPAT